MAKCSIRSCNEAAIAGFAESLEIGSVNFPRRTMPVETRYWCRRHECLALETQGKQGRTIDLVNGTETGASDRTSDAFDEQLQALKFMSPTERGALHKDGSTGERRKRERFRIDGLAEVVVANTRVVFRGKTRDLSHNGCYIVSKDFLSAAVGEEVEVRFSVSDVHFGAVAKPTVVRRGKGAGFEFLHIEETAQKDLNNLIDRLSCTTPDAPAIQPEAAYLSRES